MQLSTKGRYAVMAMVDPATPETADCPGNLNYLADIAARQRLSQSYLDQLFSKLRRPGPVRATRGPHGGYRLARPSAEIVIADIVAAVDEPIKATRCEIGLRGCMRTSGPRTGAALVGQKCQTHDLWAELGRQIALFLRDITLADVTLADVTLADVTLADVVLGHVMGNPIGLPRTEAVRSPPHVKLNATAGGRLECFGR
jgi:Rrf2 family transcriptional regulator, iron-sulfur cluster assembly transcription factor